MKLVPSDTYPHGYAALRVLAKDALSISAAVAFVSESGVRRLAELLGEPGRISVEIIARAADATTPEALLALRDDLKAEVSVVIGRHASAFHPKLWLVRSNEHLSVLSGSGNLTDGGLLNNQEQFELSQMPLNSEDAQKQEERFEELTTNAISLDVVENTTIWTDWQITIKEQQRHRREIQRLEAKLASRDVVLSREGDRRLLIDDLARLYELTVEANLKTESGKLYRPTRFLGGIERARRGERDPVSLVHRLCRHQTGGFDVILAHNRPDLTVEVLVLDKTKPYHDLFTGSTRQLSAERLEQFPDHH